jgi:hypothetical protein
MLCLSVQNKKAIVVRRTVHKSSRNEVRKLDIEKVALLAGANALKFGKRDRPTAEVARRVRWDMWHSKDEEVGRRRAAVAMQKVDTTRCFFANWVRVDEVANLSDVLFIGVACCRCS